MPVRGGDSGTQIESLPGLTYEAVEDIEYLKNKMLSALKIPKAFLGFEENVGSKATLAAEDVRFARTIERIQRIVLSELTKVAVVHLYSQGYTDSALVDFDLELTNPSTIYEQERLDLWERKNNIAEAMKREGLISQQWIYDNILNFSNKDIQKVKDQVVDDKKQAYRLQTIENEGVDPAKEAEQGQMKNSEPNDSKEDKGMEDEDTKRDTEDRDTYGVRDALGKHDYLHSAQRDDNPTTHKFRKSPLALAHFDAMKSSFAKKETELLKEVSEIDEELNGTKKKI